MKAWNRKRFSLPVIPERNHLLLLVALLFLVGCLSIFRLAVGPWMWAIAGIGLALAILLKCMGRPAALGIALCCFALATVHGGMKQRTDNRVSFVLADVTLDGKPVPGKGYCSLHYDDAPPGLFDGARIRFNGRVYHPDGKSGEPRFDFRLWMRQNNLSFGVAAYREIHIENTPDTARPSDWAYRIRQVFQRIFDAAMGDESRVAMALLFGERDGLAEDEYKAFQDLGIAHIMSVSGLHVGLVGGLLLGLLHRLRARKPVQLILLSLFLFFYCGVTGFSAAANRAAVMLLLSVLSAMVLRAPDRLTVLSAALLAVLVLNPLHAFSAGFVLSFSAMLGIILFIEPLMMFFSRVWPPVSKPKSRLRRLQQGFLATVSVSLTAQLGVMIPTAVYFHQLPLYGVLINLIIVPLVSAVLVPLYVLTALVPLAGLLASPATKLLLWLVNLLSTLPHAALRVPSPPALLAVGLGPALIMLSRRVPGSFRRRLCAACLTVLVALGGAYLQRPAELRYIQLSVGQADSALLLDGRKTILIDTGVDGEAALAYLLAENRDVDALILTHLHVDHAGGVGALLDSGIRIREAFIPVCGEQQKVDPLVLAQVERLREQGIPVHELASGDELRYNKAVLRVLWPERESVRIHQDANDYPLVLSVNMEGYTLLLASDLTGRYETYAAMQADVLKVAHHGSADSSYDPFLRVVSPRAAIISAASSSRTLPDTSTLSRLYAHGAQVLRTDETGDITLSVQNGSLIISPYKERNIP